MIYLSLHFVLNNIFYIYKLQVSLNMSEMVNTNLQTYYDWPHNGIDIHAYYAYTFPLTYSWNNLMLKVKYIFNVLSCISN